MNNLRVIQNARVLVSTEDPREVYIDCGAGVCVPVTGAGGAGLEALKESVSQLSNEKADQLIARKSGSVIMIPDASHVKFNGLTILENSEDYKIRLYGKNLFDMDTVMPGLTSTFPDLSHIHWTKEADGSYSLFNVGVLAGCTLWENTSGYDGQVSFSFVARNNETIMGKRTFSLLFEYTDGTTATCGMGCHDYFARYTWTSEAGKTVARVFQSYGENQFTYIKDVMINYGGVMEYEPYMGEREVIVSYADVSAFTDCEALAGYNTIVSDNGTDMTVEYTVDPKLYTEHVLAESKAQAASDKMHYLTSRKPGLLLYGDTSAMTKDNAVPMIWKLDYPYYLYQGDCTVKWQGSSSIAFAKKNYTIKFDRFPSEGMFGEYMPGWPREKKFCFKANYIDSSHLRNIFSAKLWGKVVKSRSVPNERLNALPNGGAIDGFPMVLFINDEFAGLYTWNIPKDGWMMGMGEGTHECIICAEGVDEFPSCVFKDTEKAFEQGFSLEYITDENDTGWALTSLNNLITAVMNDDKAALDNLLDWDSVIDYFIFTLLTGHIDGMSKNYILSTYDGTKWFFSAYDMDSTFGLHPDGSFFRKASDGPLTEPLAAFHGAYVVMMKYKKAELKARYEELRNGIMSVDNVCTDIDNFARTFPAEVYAEEYVRWKIPGSAINGAAQMKEWYHRRVEIIDAQMEAL